MASTMASSSRVVLETLTSIASRRTVVHHARPARQTVLRSPQTPKERSPTPGTSYPNLNPSSSKTASQVQSSRLQGTNYTLHYSPPPSAPSYTTGVMPPFMQWCQGNSISLSSEKGARLRKERKAEIEGGLGWDEEMLGKMKQMRAEGLSRRKIGEALSIPFEHHHLIARAAPQSSEQATAQEKRLMDLKSTWGYKKRLARDMRTKRKDFW